jgi:uncharacterized SAM-binding protein YcdF (DUF218 family)
MRLRLLLLAVLAWLIACGFLYIWPREDHPRHADAVVVLSGDRKHRLAKGLELMRRNLADTLVISDGEAPGWVAANRLCQDGASGFRVICFRPDPYSTQGEARGVAQLARARGWHSVAVVTSTFHVFRARKLFRRCVDGEVEVVGAPYKLRYLPSALFWETGKLVYALTLDRDC